MTKPTDAEWMRRIADIIESKPFSVRPQALDSETVPERLRRIADRLEEPNHWQCGCGHRNSFNLATCAQCNRRPGETP